MKTLLMSDFHIGSPLFKYKNLIELITNPMYDEIYLLGDIFDVWEKKFYKILNENKEFVKILNDLSKRKKIVFIKGNHDPSVEDMIAVFPDIIFSDKIVNNKFYGIEFKNGIIIHGEMFDSLATKYSKFARFLYYFQIMFEYLGINLQRFFRESFFSVSNKSDKEYFLDLIGDIEDASINTYTGKYKFLIMGHTHYPKIINFNQPNSFQYINCGDWISNHTYVTYENGIFELHN